MKITLKELRSLVRAEVRKTLREDMTRNDDANLIPLVEYFEDEPDEEYIVSLLDAYRRYLESGRHNNVDELMAAAETFAEQHQTVADLKEYAANSVILSTI